MSYVNRRRRRGLSGLGDYSDSDQCSSIPTGDPYRKPGNYCATPDGGITTFNSDGSTYRAPGAVDPDPAHPSGAGSSSSTSGVIGGIFNALSNSLKPAPSGPMTPGVSGGISTTTALALGGGALLLVLLISRRS